MADIDPRLPQPQQTGAPQIFGAANLYERAAKLLESQGDHEGAMAARMQAKQKFGEAYAYQSRMSGADNPAAGMSRVGQFGAGVAADTLNTVDRLRNLVGNLPDQALAERETMRAPALRTGMGPIGALSGTAVSTMIPAEAATAGIARLGELGLKLMSHPALRGAVQGAVQGALHAEPGQRTQDALTGALFGTAVPVVGAIGSRIAQGARRVPEATQLMQSMPPGTLTPGLMNPEGLISHFEQLPGVRWLYRRPREQALKEINRIAAQRVAMPGQPITIPATGGAQIKTDMVRQAEDSFAPYYDQAKGFPVSPKIMNATAPDVPLSDALTSAAKMPGAGRAQRVQADAWLQEQLQNRLDAAHAAGRPLDSADLMDFRSDVRAQRMNYEDMGTPEAENLSRIYDRANDHISAALYSQIPDKARLAVQAADARYGAFTVLRKASKLSKDQPLIAPAKYSEAVASKMPEGAYARGQDITRQQIGGQEVPNTGLRDLAQQASVLFKEDPLMRTGASNIPGGLLGLATHKAPVLTVPAAAGSALLGLTRTGRRLAQGATAPQYALQSLMRRINANPAMSGVRDQLGQLAARATVAQGLAPPDEDAAQAP
jgi:hypothetical protein